MAERFNLTAQLQLQAPTNVRQVASQIEKQLAPLGKIDVQVQADTRALSGANAQLNELNKAAKASNKSVSELNRTIAESARRFSVITVATGTLLGFVNSLKNSTKAAIEFEREVVKISQVTGKSASQLKSLTDEVTRLSTSLGASSADLLNVSRVLLQTGISADKTRQALDVLAKTSLGATFDSIQDTTEGAIALLRQFGGQARKTGREIEFLEQSLDAINAVSKNFAVESGDLVTAIRRVGGVFASAGGEVNELIALFTSVRATTRESAETIATGLRTIFTRIQRADTVNQLKELGIELQDAQGNFVGAFEAFKRLSQGLSALDPRSFRFSEIVEQLGGFRQVGKVIPLIQQFTTAQQALNVAQNSSGSVAKDAQTAQQSLAVQIQKTREQFDALIRKFADSSTFKSLASFSLQLAQSLIKVTEALEPLLPLLTSLLALKIGKGLGTGLGALASFGRGGGGAPVSRFARGGMVPGSGNTDSVPAMLTPGEFVIRKSSVKKLGAANLAAMNQNRYNKGGSVTISPKNTKEYAALTINDSGPFNPDGRSVPASAKLTAKINKSLGLRKEVGTGKRSKIKTGLTPTGQAQDDLLNFYISDQGLARTGAAKIRAKEALKDQNAAKSFSEKYQKAQKSQKTLTKTQRAGRVKEGYDVKLKGPFQAYKIGGTEGTVNAEFGTLIQDAARTALSEAVTTVGKSELVESLNIDKPKPDEQKLYSFNGLFAGAQESLEGYILEGVVGAITNAKIGVTGSEQSGGDFDYPNLAVETVRRRLSRLYPEIDNASALKRADAKRSKSTAEKGFANKVAADIRDGETSIGDIVDNRTRRNAGGGISGSDTVPALLTPGEFVINKKAASRIGGANLNRMNKQGVQGFAKGGPVGFQNGGSVAGKLQNASFGALGLVALAQQFDVLSESTSELITQTTGYVAGVAGVAGTLSQLRENAVEAAAAKRVERQASDDAAAADRREAQASNQAAGKSQGKLGKLFDNSGKGVQAFGLAALAAGAVLQGFESSARQSAAEAEKALDGFAKSAKETGSFNAKAVRENVAKAANARNQAESLAAAKTVATYTSIGALVGGPFGAAIGFAVGVLTNFNTLLEGAASFLGFGNEAREAEIKAIQDSTEAYVKSVANYANIDKKLQDVLSRPGASEEDKQKAQFDAASAILVESSSVRVAKAQDLVNLAVQKTGIGLDQLTSQSLPELESSLDGTGISARALQESAKTLALSFEQLQNAQQLAASAFQKTLNDARVGATFDQLIAEGGTFAQEFKKYKDVVRAAKLAEFERANAIKGNQAETTRLRKEFFALFKPDKDGNEGFDQPFKDIIDARNENDKRIRQEAALRALLIKRLQEQQQALQEVTEFSQGLSEQLRVTQNVTNIRGGRSSNLGFEQLDFSDNVSIQTFEKNLDKLNQSIANFPQQIRDNVKKAGESLLTLRDIVETTQANVFNAVKLNENELRQKLIDEGALGADAESVDAANAEKAAKSLLGIDISQIKNEFGTEVAGQVLLLVKEALKGGITIAEAQAIIEPLKQGTEKASEVLKQADRARRTQLKIFEDVAKRELEQRQRIAENLESLASNLEPINAAIARISGETAGQANIRLRSQAAQAGLDARAGLRGGRQLIAGDSGQLSLAKDVALAVRTSLEDRVASGKDAQGNTLTPEKIIELNKKIAQQTQIINDVNAEFLRLQDRTAQVAAIEERLAKGRKANEQAFAVLGEFVVGGKEARLALKEAATGILKATQTGTLQNQTAEQRAATVGLLDKISDVIIGNTGLTGREVKQELIFRDAVRLGFPPDIAKELATSASLEQQALDELKKQTALAQDAANRRAVGLAGGGSVAGAMFQPRGTDTVPAMLTPGEFVVRKSAVDKVGVGTLQAINSGTLYRQQGGIIPGAGNAVGSVNILPSGAFGQLFVNALSSAKSGNIKKALDSSGIGGEEAVEFLKAFNRAKKNREISKLASSPELLAAVNSTESYLNLLRGYAPTVFSKLDAKNQILNPYASQTPKGQEALNALASITGSYLSNTKGKALFANNLVSDFTGGLNVLKLVEKLPGLLASGGAVGGGAGGAGGGAGGGAAGGAVGAAALAQQAQQKIAGFASDKPSTFKSKSFQDLASIFDVATKQSLGTTFGKFSKFSDINDPFSRTGGLNQLAKLEGESSYVKGQEVRGRKALKAMGLLWARKYNIKEGKDKRQAEKQAAFESTVGGIGESIVDFIGAGNISKAKRAASRALEEEQIKKENQAKLDAIDDAIAIGGDVTEKTVKTANQEKYGTGYGKLIDRIDAEIEFVRESGRTNFAVVKITPEIREKVSLLEKKKQSLIDRATGKDIEKANEARIDAAKAAEESKAERIEQARKENLSAEYEAAVKKGNYEAAIKKKQAAFDKAQADPNRTGFKGFRADSGLEAGETAGSVRNLTSALGQIAFDKDARQANIDEYLSRRASQKSFAGSKALGSFVEFIEKGLDDPNAGITDIASQEVLDAEKIRFGIDAVSLVAGPAAKAFSSTKFGGSALTAGQQGIQSLKSGLEASKVGRGILNAPTKARELVAKTGQFIDEASGNLVTETVKTARGLSSGLDKEAARLGQRLTDSSGRAIAKNVGDKANQAIIAGQSRAIAAGSSIKESLTKTRKLPGQDKFDEGLAALKGRFKKPGKLTDADRAKGAAFQQQQRAVNKLNTNQRLDPLQENARKFRKQQQIAKDKAAEERLGVTEKVRDPNAAPVPSQQSAFKQTLRSQTDDTNAQILARKQEAAEVDELIRGVSNPSQNPAYRTGTINRKGGFNLEQIPGGGGRLPDAINNIANPTARTNAAARFNELQGRARAAFLRRIVDRGSGRREAGVTRFATGGNVSGNDRVPAMLTPGEFVMSPEAVNRYGVGYMKSLNRGRVPGFRRGGVVGRGNVQYRQNGGGVADSGAMMSLDASNIQSVLETFNQEFQATLDTVVGQFSSLTSAMNNLAGVFGSGFTMTHTFTGDMSMAFKIDNLPELQQAIAKAITPTITEQIEKTIKEQSKGFKSGG